MTNFAALLQHGAASSWLFIPSAVTLGALHGLEPGHSKTMMAAFIVAIRGTVAQAVMLGIAATISHTAVVWIIALVGLHFGSQQGIDTSEPYLQAASALMIIGVALWMLWRTTRQQRADNAHDAHEHHHDHSHDEVAYNKHSHAHAIGYQDPHELAHANDIRQRFTDREVSNGQILLFGLTGGLVPCPASVTVLLLCLQLKKITLGAALVLCFSIGLALTLVLSGVAAAISVRHVAKRWAGFGELARKAPYLSSAVILLVGVYLGYQSLHVMLQ